MAPYDAYLSFAKHQIYRWSYDVFICQFYIYWILPDVSHTLNRFWNIIIHQEHNAGITGLPKNKNVRHKLNRDARLFIWPYFQIFSLGLFTIPFEHCSVYVGAMGTCFIFNVTRWNYLNSHLFSISFLSTSFTINDFN